MSRIKELFRGKGKVSFLILYVYLLAMLILHNSLNHAGISKIFFLFMAGIALLITCILLYTCRNLPAFQAPSSSDFTAGRKPTSGKALFCGIGAVFLFTLFSCAFACTDRFYSFQDMNAGLLLQSLLFAAALSCLALVLYRNGCAPAFLLAVCLWIFFYLSVNGQAVFQSSSIALAAFAVLLMAAYMQTILSHGKWLQNTVHAALFFLAGALCVSMTRLAVLFVLPLALIAVFYTVRDLKKRIALVVSILAACVLLCGISAYTRNEDASERVPDTIGLHLSIWCNIMHAYPSALPQETQNLLYSLMPQEIYDSYDYTAGFYSVSDSELIDYDGLASLSFINVFKYTYQCFRFAPDEALETLAYTTSGLWKIMAGTHGLELLTLLIVAAALLARNRISILHICPEFLYGFGSMLCLGGPRPDLYFFITPLWPALLYLMMADKSEFHSAASHQERTGAIR